jgi:hypothetical protein
MTCSFLNGLKRVSLLHAPVIKSQVCFEERSQCLVNIFTELHASATWAETQRRRLHDSGGVRAAGLPGKTRWLFDDFWIVPQT